MNERLSDEYIADCLWGYDHGNAMDDPDVIGVLNEALARGRELDEATKGRLRFLELFEQAEQQLDAAIARAEKAEGQVERWRELAGVHLGGKQCCCGVCIQLREPDAAELAAALEGKNDA